MNSTSGKTNIMVDPKIKAEIKKEVPGLLDAICTNIGNHFKFTDDPMPDATIVDGKYMVKKAVICNGFSVNITVEIQIENE